MDQKEINDYIERQKLRWSMAADNYAALEKAETKQLPSGIRVQHNPARIASTGAKVDKDSVRARACFLCAKNRPLQQSAIDWGEYQILVNPYPILPHHLTIPVKKHEPQLIAGRIGDMAVLSEELPGYTVFYNGPRCGASAPDHMHFQAVCTESLPIWDYITDSMTDQMSATEVLGRVGIMVIHALSIKSMEALFDKVYHSLPQSYDEPMMNILMRHTGSAFTCVVIPRKQHRPSFYGTGKAEMLISPASLDLAGLVVAPRAEDFAHIDDDVMQKVVSELCYSGDEVRKFLNTASTVSVGIISSSKLEIALHGHYLVDGDKYSGVVSLSAVNVKDTIHITPLTSDAYVEVKDVTIGVNFHWQRRENQCFRGAFRIVRDGENIVLINDIDIEDYLTSVISSEMNATSSIELLKAHAVISRSWVMARKQNTARKKEAIISNTDKSRLIPKRTVWYDHDDHQLFDVCADDHCQRYQGITRASTKAVTEAIEATCGQVLTYDGVLCDTRFSKCCGGVFEKFESCWEDKHYPYLIPLRDSRSEHDYPDLSIEENAREWILSEPEAFCNTKDDGILREVLNNYDADTTPDFYRWTVEYETSELSDIILRKSGYDFGRIIDLIPLSRGSSGRITSLRIVGDKFTMDIGKELEIRRWLSETHLYSSAFVVDHTDTGFILHGAGWGHGVGLCQIGAAMMAHKGYDFRAILAHYYPGAEISNL